MKNLPEQVFDGRLCWIVEVFERRAVPNVAHELNHGHFKDQNTIRLKKGCGGPECFLEVWNVFEDGDCQFGVEPPRIALLHAAVEQVARDHLHPCPGGLLGHAFFQFDAKTIVSLAQQLQGKAVGATDIQHVSPRLQNAQQAGGPGYSMFGGLRIFLIPDGGVGWGREILVCIQALDVLLKLFDNSVAAPGALQHVDAIGALPERDKLASATDDTFGVVTSHKVGTWPQFKSINASLSTGALPTPVDELVSGAGEKNHRPLKSEFSFIFSSNGGGVTTRSQAAAKILASPRVCQYSISKPPSASSGRTRRSIICARICLPLSLNFRRCPDGGKFPPPGSDAPRRFS